MTEVLTVHQMKVYQDPTQRGQGLKVKVRDLELEDGRECFLRHLTVGEQGGLHLESRYSVLHLE